MLRLWLCLVSKLLNDGDFEPGCEITAIFDVLDVRDCWGTTQLLYLVDAREYMKDEAVILPEN